MAMGPVPRDVRAGVLEMVVGTGELCMHHPWFWMDRVASVLMHSYTYRAFGRSLHGAQGHDAVEREKKGKREGSTCVWIRK